MNKADEDRQIRETRSLLQKAGQRNAPLDTVSAIQHLSHVITEFYINIKRRDALRRLINLTHMASRELKVFAAQNFSHYFKDFPELEEDVIDSVYDICEDPDSQVIRMSRSGGSGRIPCSCFRCASKDTRLLYHCLPNPESGLDETQMCLCNSCKAVCLYFLTTQPKLTLS